MLVAEADSRDCAADHRGASYACSLEVDGATVRVTTLFQDGRDPDDACAGPLTATCEAEVEAQGYRVEFNGQDQQVIVPLPDEICLYGGGG